ncbi:MULTISPECIES: 5'-nucleotidase C-terminal domain-containing protein [Geobacillus]|uniref:5'-nucleotidase n=3 Tax=Geobacillus TaxID=129337 RepID=A0A1Q5SKH9_9BACL|nr:MULTISPECIES: 5'-nucleotidase C-terminal domain-containing protein [Geobacillus]OKO88537.1 5'-nucleotidase [Geobacillus proteiniphilus]
MKKRYMPIAALSALSLAAEAAAPGLVQAADAGRAEQLVAKAEALAGALKWEVSYEYRKQKVPDRALDYPDMRLFQETKQALQAAEQEVRKMSGKEREGLEARLSEHVRVYVQRAVAYIDAVSAGKSMAKKAQELAEQLNKGEAGRALEQAYHALSKEIRTKTPILYRVYGASTRQALFDGYVKPAERVRQVALYPVSIQIEADRLRASVAEGRLDDVIACQTRIDRWLKEGNTSGAMRENSRLRESIRAYAQAAKNEAATRWTIIEAASTDPNHPTAAGGTAGKEQEYDRPVVLLAGDKQYVRFAYAHVKGDVLIKGKGNGAGTVVLDHVHVTPGAVGDGKLIVDDISEHTLYQRSVSAEQLDIRDVNGAHIVASEGTRVKTVRLIDEAGSEGTLVLEAKEAGAYDSLVIEAAHSRTLVELRGNFSKTNVQVAGNGASVNIKAGTVVQQLDVKAGADIVAEKGAEIQAIDIATAKQGERVQLKGDLAKTTVVVSNGNGRIEIGDQTVVKEIRKGATVQGTVEIANRGVVQTAVGVAIQGQTSGTVSNPGSVSGASGGGMADVTPPHLSLASSPRVTVGKDITVQSDEEGIVYAVPSSEQPHSLAELEALVSSGKAKKISLTAPGTNVRVSTSGWPIGTYRLYEADRSGNVSAPTDTLTVEPFELMIMHTNDTHGHLERAARRMTAIKQVRTEHPDALLLDAGDVFSGTLYSSEFNGLADLALMNLAGYDAMTFGNHEFDKGTGVLADFVKEARFPFVSANVDLSNDVHLGGRFHDTIASQPENGNVYEGVIKEVNGEKIGIFGLTTAETKQISSPGDGVKFEDYLQEARKAVDDLRRQGVNKIIALTHIGFNDGGGDNDLTLAKEVEGIDIIVGGHSHDKLAEPVIDRTGEEPTVIVQANEYNKYLGTLDVQFDEQGKVISYAGKLIDIDQKTGEMYVLKEDEEAAALLDEKYTPKIVEKQTTVVGQTTVPLVGGNPPARVGETNLGNMIADGMLARAKQIDPSVSIAFQNGGGVRTSIPAGTITLGKLLEVMPFGNSLAIMRLTGEEIKQALEVSVKDAPTKPFGGFLQVAGLRFVYDSRQPVGQKVVFIEVNEGGRYIPLDPNKTYGVATNNFTAKGGDGYEVFAKAYREGRVSEPGFVDWEMAKQYIESQPDKTVAPNVEGRILDLASIVVPAAEFSGTADKPKMYNGHVAVEAKDVNQLQYAVIKGNLYIRGNHSVTLDHVTVEGDVYLLD